MTTPPDHPVKDPDAESRVALVLRPTFCAIVDAFRAGDFGLATPIRGVDAVDAATARQIAEYLTNYGETLVALPEQGWNTSVSRWMGSDWHVLVDLFTEESGRSDMVLDARVREDGDGYSVRIHMVYVP